MRHLPGVTIVACISVYVVEQIVSRCIIPKLITSTNGFFQCLEVSSVLLKFVFFQICLAFTTWSCFFFSTVILAKRWIEVLVPTLRGRLILCREQKLPINWSTSSCLNCNMSHLYLPTWACSPGWIKKLWEYYIQVNRKKSLFPPFLRPTPTL